MWCAFHHSQRGAPTSDTQVCTLLHPSPLYVASARTATASSLGAIRVKDARTLQATGLALKVVVPKHLCHTSAFQFSCTVVVTCFYSRGRETGIWGSNQWLWSPLLWVCCVTLAQTLEITHQENGWTNVVTWGVTSPFPRYSSQIRLGSFA